jgi:hypothetical protein
MTIEKKNTLGDVVEGMKEFKIFIGKRRFFHEH